MGRAQGIQQAITASRRGTGSGAGVAVAAPVGAIPQLRIQYDSEGNSIGRYVVGSEEKEHIDIIRDGLVAGERSFLFHGPHGTGKTASAEQIAAIFGFALIDLGPADPETEGCQLEVGGRSYGLDLDKKQIAAITALERPGVVLHVHADNPWLQAALAAAAREGGEFALNTETKTREPPWWRSRSLQISDDALIIFEVQEDLSTSLRSPGLDFRVIKDTTPLAFTAGAVARRQPLIEKLDATGGWAEPVDRSSVTSDYLGGPRVQEDMWEMRKAISTIDWDGRRRRTALEQLETHVSLMSHEYHDAPSRAFIERVFANAEIQAYQGDVRADRTCLTNLACLLPPAQRGDNEWMHLADAITTPEFREYLDAVYALGSRERESAQPSKKN